MQHASLLMCVNWLSYILVCTCMHIVQHPTMAPKRKYNADEIVWSERIWKRQLVKRQMKERGDEETRRMRQILAYKGSEECKKPYGVNVCKLNACT